MDDKITKKVTIILKNADGTIEQEFNADGVVFYFHTKEYFHIKEKEEGEENTEKRKEGCGVFGEFSLIQLLRAGIQLSMEIEKCLNMKKN